MKFGKKIKSTLVAATAFALAPSVWADDAKVGGDLAKKLTEAVNGDVQTLFGSNSVFWKMFILVDIILAAALAVKTKNPMTFLGVLAIALVPGFLIRAFVF